ncbi:MAG: transglycosylase SLT domain-containing protein [Gemmatimonadales bacterium]
MNTLVGLVCGTLAVAPAHGGRGAVRPRATTTPPAPCSTMTTLHAESLLAEGRYWHAWRALPPLRAGARAMRADSVVLYASAAEGLGRFRTVDSLLRRARGGDSVPAIVLLSARGDERSERWRDAERRYRRVLALGSADEATRAAAARLPVMLELAGMRDSAIQAWRRAAIAVPELADWFAIRRAALEADTSIAFAAVSSPRTPGAALSGQLFIAQRRADAGDFLGALDLFGRFGKSLDVAHVEYSLGRRLQARLRADSVLFKDPSSVIKPDAMLAAAFITRSFDTLSFAENIAMSRAYRAHGDRLSATRFVRNALARLKGRGLDTLAVAGWLEMARIESERRDFPAAMRAVDSAGARASPLGAGLIGAARVQVETASDRWEAAETLLGRLVEAHAGDTSVARALLGFADRNRSRSETETERARYLTLLRRFQDAPAANAARFRLGLIAYMEGARDSALALVRDAARRDSAHALGLGPRYWEARLRLESGDLSARADLRRLAADFPIAFYGVRAREILGDSAFLSDTVLALPRPGTFAPARARERIRMLSAFGFDAEARAEATGWASDTTVSVYVLMAAAQAAADEGYARESIVLGDAVRSRVGMVQGAARALFPIPYRSVLEGEGGELCIDPLLLAALIRQESRFDPRAVSRVGARGIGQVMPATGRQLAERMRMGPWDREFLFVPDFNLHLGVRYIADRQARDSFPTYALLAAYNAGAGRVAKWKSWPEYPDPDLFAERVSIIETRDYVRNVYASYVWYQVAWKSSPEAPPERPASLVP